MSKRTLTIFLMPLRVPATIGTLHMLRSGAAGYPLRLIGADSAPACAESCLFDRYYRMPAFDDPAFGEQLAALCTEEGVDFLLAQTEPAALEIARRKSQLQAKGAQSLHSSYESSVLAGDKAAFLSACAHYGLATPSFALLGSVEELEVKAQMLGYPETDLVVKPTQCGGRRGLHLVSARMPSASRLFIERGVPRLSLEDLRAVLERSNDHPPLLLMEHLPGEEYSVDAFVGKYHRVAVSRRRQRVMEGTAIESVLESDAELVDQTFKAAQGLGLTQLFGMQFKRDAQGRAKLLECNPRIQGNQVASLFSGVNLTWLAIEEALGVQRELPPLRDAVTVQRTFGGIAYQMDWHEVF